jgi:hypothetical protein
MFSSYGREVMKVLFNLCAVTPYSDLLGEKIWTEFALEDGFKKAG